VKGMRRFISSGLVIACLLAIAAVSGAWTVTVVQQGEGGPPDLSIESATAMTIRVHGVGHTYGQPIEAVGTGATESGNALVYFAFTSYTCPLAVDFQWHGDEFDSVEVPHLPGVIYNTDVTVEIRADGKHLITVTPTQKKVDLGGGRMGYKGGNEVLPESLPFLCPQNRYYKPVDGELQCAP
jgi:hypothetical protein